MRLLRESIEDTLRRGDPVIGFWGAPPAEALEEAARRLPGAPFYDLDVHRDAPRSGLVPDAFCHIIRNCVDNAAVLGPTLARVVAATGPEKCDAGRFAARVVRDALGVPVVACENSGAAEPAEPSLCESEGPPKARAVRIMEAIVEPLDAGERAAARAARCEPTCGFWGTPPHPIEVLDLFPDTTHLFGWTRCVERGRPADLDLELDVPDGLPIVFFSQGFCPKAILARRLAARHRGMHVDVHDTLHAATVAKIEAFLRLAAPGSRP